MTTKPAPDVKKSPPQQQAASQSPSAARPAHAAISLASPGVARTPDSSGLDAALIGRTYSGAVNVNGFNVPLPPGKWAVLSNIRVGSPNAPGTGLFLGRIENRRLVGGLRVLAVRSIDTVAGAPFKRACVSGNPRLNDVFLDPQNSDDHQACWLMFNYYTPPWQQWADRGAKIAQLDRIAAGDLAAKGVTYAQDLMAAQFYRAEKWGVVQVDYLFSPDTEGIKSTEVLSFTDSDWNASNIGRFPEKAAYVARLKEWANTFWPKFRSAFDQGRPAGSASAPEVAASVQPVGTPVPGGVPDQAGKDCLAAAGARQPAQSTVPGLTQSRLPVQGLWCFFDSTGRLHEVRMDLPYSGAVDGVRLGDSIESVKGRLGEPSLQRPFGTKEAYIYNRGPSFERFDVEAGTVQTIFVGQRGRP